MGPIHHRWSQAEDARLRRLRAEGASWGAIAAAFGVSLDIARERGRRIGARRPPPEFAPPPDDPNREPLPPGHPRSWNLICAGTILAGSAYATEAAHDR